MPPRPIVEILIYGDIANFVAAKGSRAIGGGGLMDILIQVMLLTTAGMSLEENPFQAQPADGH